MRWASERKKEGREEEERSKTKGKEGRRSKDQPKSEGRGVVFLSDRSILAGDGAIVVVALNANVGHDGDREGPDAGDEGDKTDEKEHPAEM